MLSRFTLPRGVLAAGALAAVAAGLTRLRAADHRDSAVLTANPAQDIADVYSFQSPANPANIVLAMTVSGFIPPAEAATAAFDPGVLYQWKIDTNGDAREDLVIQAFVTGAAGNQVMHFVGPARPAQIGAVGTLLNGSAVASVRVSNGSAPVVTTAQGISVFAGVRDDPFFFDLVRFNAVIAGQATGFRNPGIDTFAGFNVLALVVEFPKPLLGTTGTIGVWATTSTAN
jgi:hypothetical protein